MTPPAASAAAAPAIHPRRTAAPRRVPAAPRRRSGPLQSGRNPARAVGIAEAVATHRLLDRLIRGRIWIGVIAFALIGIVTMQLGLLKLNAGIGRSLAHEALLQRENATLSTENSEMAAGERVEAQAEHAGMELIPAGALHFLAAHPSSDASKAAAALSSAPSAQATGTTSQTEMTSQTETATGAPSAAATSTSASSEAATTGASETETATSASSPPADATSETTGQSGATPEARTDASETAEPPVSSASTETSAGGAGEATSPSTSTSTGGGTTGG
jgi:hypothetical protein